LPTTNARWPSKCS